VRSCSSKEEGRGEALTGVKHTSRGVSSHQGVVGGAAGTKIRREMEGSGDRESAQRAHWKAG
jgi:hypothetical protein